MAVLTSRRVPRVRGYTPLRLDRSHPLTVGLQLSIGQFIGGLPYDAAGAVPRDAAWSTVSTSRVDRLRGGAFPGVEADYSGGAVEDEYIGLDTARFLAWPATHEWWVRWSSTNFRTVAGLRNGSFTGHLVQLERTNLSNGRLRVKQQHGTNVSIDGVTALSDGQLIHVILVSRASNDHEVYLDGVSEQTSTSDAGTTTTDYNRVKLGRGYSGNAWDSDILRFSYWNRALSAEEVAALADDPHRIYQSPARRRVFAAGGGASVAAPAGTFTLTGNAPTVSTGVDVAAPAGTFTLTGNAPTIGSGVDVAAPAGTFALTGNVPAVAAGASVAAPAGAFTLTGNAPTVSTGVIVTVPAGAFALTGNAPVVTAGGAVNIATPQGSFALAGNVPAVAAGASVATPTGTFSLAGNAPTITTTVQVAPPAGTFALAGNAPAVAAGASVAAPSGTYTLTGNAPTITATSGTDDQLAFSEFRMVALTHNGGNVLAPETPALTEQRVTIGGTSAQSAAFGEYARFIRIVAPVTCFLEFGEDPTATEAGSMRIVANRPELLGVTPGHKLAVIAQA